MNLNDRLDRVRDELTDEVASDVRVPSFAGILARRARRRRLQAAAGGAALIVVAAGVLGGVAATRPDAHRSVPPAVTVSASTPPTSPATATPSAASGMQTYPAKGSSYVVVPDGDWLAWTDLKTGAHGHFGPADGSELSDPSVSADGRRVAYVSVTGGSASVDYWDLDTRASRTVIETNGSLSTPSISPDGTRFAWFEQGSGISIATFGRNSQSGGTVASDGGAPTWVGKDALAYLPANASGDCAVERIELSTRATQCLLPTATLTSVFAKDGSTWQIDSISGSSDGSVLALGVTTTNQAQRGIGLLDTSAEATPFRVLPATIVNESGPFLYLGPPVLLGGDSRVLYQQAQGGGNAHVMSVDLATGEKTEVTAAFGGDLELGLGATLG